MSVCVQQEVNMNSSENLWDAIALNSAVSRRPTSEPEVDLPDDHRVEEIEGNGNSVSDHSEETHSDEIAQGDLDGADFADVRSRDIAASESNRSQSPPANKQVAVYPYISPISKSPQVLSSVKEEPYYYESNSPGTVLGVNNQIQRRMQNFVESTDEEGSRELRQTGNDGEMKAEVEDNILGKRSRSPVRKGFGTSGKKLKGGLENDFAASASKVECLERYAGLKLQDQRYRAEWVEPQGSTILLPPGLEKLHRVFTSLNTAYGFLQREQLEPSWENVKNAVQQLSGTTDDLLAVEDVQTLAHLCPRMIALTKVSGDGENASFNVELSDPAEPENGEDHGMAPDGQRSDPSGLKPGGRQISDSEARLIVERRQKSFQTSLLQISQQLQASELKESPKPIPIPSPAPRYSSRHLSNDSQPQLRPAILALPTQNLVLSPPPLLPQHLQLQHSYHPLPFPAQVQAANSYPVVGYHPQRQSNYVGFQLPSIPSTSQASHLPSQPVSYPVQPNTIPAGESTELVLTTEPSFAQAQAQVQAQAQAQAQVQAQSLNKSKRRRARNWDTWEVVLLVQAKKTEWERGETAAARDRFESSSDRWRRVATFLRDNRVVDRDANACKNKWESLLSDYKAVKDWNRKAGNAPYSSLTPGEKKAGTLPPVCTPLIIDLLDSFQGKSTHVSLPSAVDSLAKNAPTVSGGDRSEGEESGEAVPPNYHADGMHPSVQKRRKSSGGYSLLLAAFEKISASMINMEKGRDDRSEKLLALENQKYELEKSKLELLGRKVELEREDRKSLVRVLGNLASAFHRMADKM